MTRFARARGSKSSNERLPEQATSWNVMKQQLQDKLQSSESVTDTSKSTAKIWKSSDFELDAWNRNNSVWVKFEDNPGSVKKSTQHSSKKTKKGDKRKSILHVNECLPNSLEGQKKSKKRKLEGQNVPETDEHDLFCHEDKLAGIINTVKAKKKKLKKSTDTEDCDITMIEEQANVHTINTSHAFNSARKQKQKNKLGGHRFAEKEETGEDITKKTYGKKRDKDPTSISEMCADQPVTKLPHKNTENGSNFESSDYTQLENSFVKLKNVDRKKKKSSRAENKTEDLTTTFQIKKHIQDKGTELQEVICSNVQTPKEKKHKQKYFENPFQGSQKVSPKQEKFSQEVAKAFKNKNSEMKMEKNIKRPKWQHQNDKIKRKHNFVGTDNMGKKRENWKKNEHVTVLYMNGRDIEIVKFDGFPVKREDAENLKILKQKLIANGVPSDEIKTTMKLERRKAEKALAREKKKVCFHCRKSGHVLSECPELGKVEMEDASGTGICFKCGSTEHRSFECRVTREQEFRFAKCFVCDEQGHIARQCPDNPRGLYPKGGACHVCGDVTHLKKDCPDLIKGKEQKTIRLPTLSSKSLELLEEADDKTLPEPTKQIKRKKTIKF